MTTLKNLVGNLNTWFFPITPPNLNTFSLNKNCDGCLGITKSKIFKMAESSQVRKKKKKEKNCLLCHQNRQIDQLEPNQVWDWEIDFLKTKPRMRFAEICKICCFSKTKTDIHFFWISKKTINKLFKISFRLLSSPFHFFLILSADYKFFRFHQSEYNIK